MPKTITVRVTAIHAIGDKLTVDLECADAKNVLNFRTLMIGDDWQIVVDDAEPEPEQAAVKFREFL